jgi:hypothetical protein
MLLSSDMDEERAAITIEIPVNAGEYFSFRYATILRHRKGKGLYSPLRY